MRIKKFLSIALCLALCLSFTACGNSGKASEKASISIAYQYGMAYAPFIIMKDKGFLEQCYGEEIEVNWQQLNSGAAINEGIMGGTLDAGAMGIAPFISGVSSGVKYKLFSALSSQKHGLMTNDSAIKSLKDIKSKDKIALVNIGSIQHILLAMAAKKELGDAHALDGNISAMAHPDGMTALESGSVSLHLTSSPYIYKELANSKLHEVAALSEVWPDGNSFIVGIASEKMHENTKLYNALVKANQMAIDYINSNKSEAAKLLCENEGVTEETMLTWLNDSACGYSSETKGVTDMAKFMSEADFAENVPTEMSKLGYSNVKGN